MSFIFLAYKSNRKKIWLQLLFTFVLSIGLAQEKTTITGKATDGEAPLSNVSVRILESNKGTTTNKNGEFLIVASKGQTLVFSYVGFEDQALLISDLAVMNVILKHSYENDLKDVVVIGYGTKKKVNLTGAVSVVSAKQLKDRPITNISSALQGAMAGVTVEQKSGQPGDDYGTIRVRGIGTLGNSDAMVVVDGVVSTLNDVNPNDIETITVLKDAASASIYGSRASNGVILVTTKKGKLGAATVHYNAYVGKQKPTRLPDYLPSWQAASIYNNALMNEGNSPRYTDAEVQKFKDGSDPDNYPNTNWLNLFYRGKGFQQNHYVDVSGGNEKTQSLLSLGYFSQDGIVKNSGFSRYTSRFKISTKLGSRFTVNGNLAYTFEDFQEPTNPLTNDFAGFFREINRASNILPYKYSNGYYGYYDNGNPMAWLEAGSQNKNKAYYLRGIVDGDLEVVKGLHFKPLVGYLINLNQSKKFIKDIQFYDRKTGLPTLYQGPNSLTDRNDNQNIITLQGLLQYDKSLGDHEFTIFGGYSQEYTHYSYLQGYRKSFLNNSLGELNAGPVSGQQATGSAYEVALESVFGRVSYDYKSKYLLEGNIRYDGSSRFAPENRWGVYPSFSAGWRISEESFFKPLNNIISELKFRGSWGILGNQNLNTITNSNGSPIGNYPYIPTIASGQNYVFGSAVAPGVAPLNGANPLIKWESTRSGDIGLDASLLKGKISLTADYFIRNTNNILLNIPVGNVYGFNSPVQNGGSVQNKGVELEIGYHGEVKKFFYNISGNASFIKNTVTDLKGTDPIINDFSFMKVGYPINSFYGYQAEGIFKNQEQVDKHATQSGGIIAPGDLIYKDQNGDGVINGSDRVYLGNFFPKITYGLSINIGWRGFDLTAFIQGASGLKGLIRDDILGKASNSVGKPTAIFIDYWTSKNPTTKFPRLWNAYTQNNPLNYNSSFWVRDAGYMRLKNLQAGYTLSAKWLTKVGIQKARIYYSGQNILTVTQFYKWVDPEAPAGERGSTHPQVFVNTIGFNITF